jgi:hypothetical protein
VVTTIQRVVLDLDGPRVVRLKLPADQHRSSLCDDVKCRGSEWADVQWAAEGSQLAFVSTSRDHRAEVFRIANATTGEVRDVMKEEVPTFFESGNGRVNWHYLAGSKELIWFSERDNWGHLYLYDTESGTLKNQITTGDWNVTQFPRRWENRVLLFGVGRRGRDPYFVRPYRISPDGGAWPSDSTRTQPRRSSPLPENTFDSYSGPMPARCPGRDDSGKLHVAEPGRYPSCATGQNYQPSRSKPATVRPDLLRPTL